MFEWLLVRCLDGFVPDLPAPTVASESQAETCCCRLLGGLSSEILGEVLQSTLGPVGRLGSKLFRGKFCKVPWGQREALAASYWGEILLSALGPVGVLLTANFSGEILLSTLGPVGGLGSELFGRNFAKYPGASGRAFDSERFGGNFATYPGASRRAWQRTFRGKFC